MKAKKQNETASSLAKKYCEGMQSEGAETVAAETFEAYSDCIEELEDSGEERNLKFIASRALPLVDALYILKKIGGYNGFDAEAALKNLAPIFGLHAQVFIAREYSVCLYIRPSKRIWFSREIEVNCDEFSFEPLQSAFRLWWD